MRLLLILLMATALSGCSSFIVRDKDNAAVATAKVASRVLIGIPTLGMSEMGIAASKHEEAIAAQVAECRSRSMVPVTSGEMLAARFHGCFTQSGFEQYMAAQASQPGPNPMAALMMMQMLNQPQPAAYKPLPVPNLVPPTLRANCNSLTTGSMTTTNCY